jgi:hypothetical protein
MAVRRTVSRHFLMDWKIKTGEINAAIETTLEV